MSRKSAEKEGNKAALAGAASAALAYKAPKNLLGYEKVYHGTSSSAADSIKQTGLKKSKSGSGVAANDVAAGRASASEVKGKVYTTRNKALADNHQPGLAGLKMGKTLKARVPYRAKSRLAKDVVMHRMADGTDEYTKGQAAQKLGAKMSIKHLRIYKHSIPSRFIEGGKGYAGRKQFATKSNMRRYFAQAGGKARFAKGVAQAAGSVGAGMYAIAKNIQARKELKKD